MGNRKINFGFGPTSVHHLSACCDLTNTQDGPNDQLRLLRLAHLFYIFLCSHPGSVYHHPSPQQLQKAPNQFQRIHSCHPPIHSPFMYLQDTYLNT